MYEQQTCMPTNGLLTRNTRYHCSSIRWSSVRKCISI